MKTNLSVEQGKQAAVSISEMANAIRFLAIDMVEAASSGHPGMPMGMADVATVLFLNYLKFNPENPDWPDRDRFILSAGHGSALLYSLLYLTGYGLQVEDLKNFRQLGSKTPGHPEYGLTPGVETTTGPLGQGLGNAVGMALAEEMLQARFSEKLVDHYTYVLASDGDLMEGISHEALALAGHLRLNKLIVLFDDNGITIDGNLALSASDDVLKRCESYGFITRRINGHDAGEIDAALTWAKQQDRPVFIACVTKIGFGSPNLVGSEKCHGSPLGAKEAAEVRKALDWNHQPFTIPQDILTAWRGAASRNLPEYSAWKQRFDLEKKETQREFTRVMDGQLPYGWPEAIAEVKVRFTKENKPLATRKASQAVLDGLKKAVPELIGGSADLSGSNGTLAKGMKPIKPGDFSGDYIHYGIREHGMAAIMNGLNLHGGFIPYGGSFLAFTDYCKPSIRLAALMKLKVVFVMTHDSIGLGEDGPTHQPVEQLAGLRAIPNLLVLRPADAVETAECWALALANQDGPSVLVLTRQDLPLLRHSVSGLNECGQGGYILQDCSKLPDAESRRVTLISTGSEVSIAVDARTILEGRGIPTRVVSMPCTALFERQGEVYRRNTLGQGHLKVVIEAASPFGWDRYFGKYGFFIGMRSFGESAPYQDLYQHFGITSEAIANAVSARLEG